MGSALISRNVTIAGRRTSLRLEAELWNALLDICTAEGITIHQLCSLIDNLRSHCGPGTSRTSAVRTFVISYFRAAANLKGAEASLTPLHTAAAGTIASLFEPQSHEAALAAHLSPLFRQTAQRFAAAAGARTALGAVLA